ncbi:uncharacterized protein BDR25DRAFT_323067 [Lindgomyces ingoldianus]|uniref:Uncharacterized protein n=1 Tax=Lindgomyces ingoldianus TaxID=673940 RepID=A0ACB6R9J5_9PLEO|nr:uncharacterized protein BDR25DRAFT_323067 [Lindgomyces ingoldianus]KAF2474997.1 hypothetical protein BDR25DRAFT_323067 [Lindgomyces ingoldianus]
MNSHLLPRVDSKKTYLLRSRAAKLAELKGVISCYLNLLPQKFIRSMAGHLLQMGCFKIPRAAVMPPDKLLSLIWPELNVWKGRFSPHASQINDLAAGGLTSLLLYLRERFPSHPVWSHLDINASLNAEAALTAAPPSLADVDSSRYTSAQASLAPTPSARSPSPSPLPAALELAPELEPALKHRMCRAVRTVEDLWREWTWYSLRLKVIKEIRRIAQAQRTSEEAAMWQVS